jgi:hypothetical protein
LSLWPARECRHELRRAPVRYPPGVRIARDSRSALRDQISPPGYTSGGHARAASRRQLMPRLEARIADRWRAGRDV